MVEVKAVDSQIESALELVESLVCSAIERMEEDSTELVGVGFLCRLYDDTCHTCDIGQNNSNP